MCDEKELKKRFRELRNILSRRALNSFVQAVSDRMGETAQEAMDNTLSGWKDLDIDNLPDRFFTRDDIEIERKIETQYYLIVKGDLRVNIIKGLLEGIKYRYR
jgi:hypothetical protein